MRLMQKHCVLWGIAAEMDATKTIREHNVTIFPAI